MVLKCEILLVFVYCSARSIATSPNQPNHDKSSCIGKITLGFDRSSKLSNTSYAKQVNFLLENVFNDQWTRYEDLALMSYADTVNSTKFGQLKNRKDLQEFIKQNKQSTEKLSICEVFAALAKSDINGTNIVLFASYYEQEQEMECVANAKKIREQSNSVTLVVLDFTQIDTEGWTKLFPVSKIIWWDVRRTEAPVNWDHASQEAFGCDSKLIPYPCDTSILLAYDRSSNLEEGQFEAQKTFILDYLFGRWTFYRNLALWNYANSTINSNPFGYFKNSTELKEFIKGDSQSDEQPVLCNVISRILELNASSLNVILFVSFFDKNEVTPDCSKAIEEVQRKFNKITLVCIGDDDKQTDLKKYFQNATFLFYNLFMTPPDWEMAFWDAFGCNDENLPGYPCNGKIIVGFDRSSYLSKDAYNRQREFIKTKIFTDDWDRFNQVSMMNYGLHEEAYTNYGLLKDLDEVRGFVDAFVQDEAETTLCEAAYALEEMTVNGAHIILFVSQLDADEGESCFQIRYVNDSAARLTIFSLTDKVNTTALKLLFSNVSIINWDIENADEKYEPKGWRQMLWDSLGCEGLSPLIGTTLMTTESTTESPTTTPTKTTTKKTTVKKTTRPATTVRTTTPVPPFRLGLYLGIFIPLAVLIFYTFLIFFCLYRRKQNQRQEMWKNALREGYIPKLDDNAYFSRRNTDPWQILFENVLINYNDKLGAGAFADVYSGKLVGDSGIKRVYEDSPVLSNFYDCDVAIKMLPPFADNGSKEDFMQEINFMKSLKFHPHLVCLLGYVSSSAKPLLILEYCANGNLLNFVRKNKEHFVQKMETQETSKIKQLVSFAWQIANGLEYLSTLGLIHRDVAARNVLLDKENICKIGDFGLCRTSETTIYTSKGGRLPFRWMSIESLKMFIYSAKTDVWSYGVLLFEIFSLGEIPYLGLGNSDVLDFLEAGKRLPRPKNCNDDIYELMSECWRESPDDRPTFTVICTKITKLLEDANLQYNYVDAIRNIEIQMSDSDSEVTV